MAVDNTPLGVPTTDFSHHSDEFAEAPFEVANDLRSKCPVAWSTAHDGFWVFTRYQDVTEILRDWETFSSAQGSMVPNLSFGTTHIPVTVDPPEHHVYRKYLNPWFSLEAMNAREQDMRAAVVELVEGLRAKGEWDFVQDMGDILPGMQTLAILGVDPSRREPFLSAMERGMMHQGTKDETLIAQMKQDSLDIQEMLKAEIAARHEKQTDDLMSYLVREPLPDGRQLTDGQIVDMVMVLILAGFHTTSSALTSLLVHLARHPEQRDYLQKNRDKIPGAIEEISRVYSPAMTVGRKVTQDREIGGAQVRQGDMVLAFIMAAGHDEAQFPDAERIDFERSNKSSVAFGWGVHRCLGIHMARQLIRIEIEALFDLIPDYEIDLERVKLAEKIGLSYVHEFVPARIP